MGAKNLTKKYTNSTGRPITILPEMLGFQQSSMAKEIIRRKFTFYLTTNVRNILKKVAGTVIEISSSNESICHSTTKQNINENKDSNELKKLETNSTNLPTTSHFCDISEKLQQETLELCISACNESGSETESFTTAKSEYHTADEELENGAASKIAKKMLQKRKVKTKTLTQSLRIKRLRQKRRIPYIYNSKDIDSKALNKISKYMRSISKTDHKSKLFLYNYKISSWNLCGIRMWLRKGGLRYLELEQPDIFCMQDLKCTFDKLPTYVRNVKGYHRYWLCTADGSAGVAIFSKRMPINIDFGLQNTEFNGRIITAEYKYFYLVNVNAPSSGTNLVKLQARMCWESAFQQYLEQLKKCKPIVICGNMNVAHQKIDVKNPKSKMHIAGFTKQERKKLNELLSNGYIDTYRYFHPKLKNAYTYWSPKANARALGIGWRFDYCIVSQGFLSKITDCYIQDKYLESDHCPIAVLLNL